MLCWQSHQPWSYCIQAGAPPCSMLPTMLHTPFHYISRYQPASSINDALPELPVAGARPEPPYPALEAAPRSAAACALKNNVQHGCMQFEVTRDNTNSSGSRAAAVAAAAPAAAAGSSMPKAALGGMVAAAGTAGQLQVLLHHQQLHSAPLGFQYSSAHEQLSHAMMDSTICSLT